MVSATAKTMGEFMLIAPAIELGRQFGGLFTSAAKSRAEHILTIAEQRKQFLMQQYYAKCLQ